MRSWDLLLLLLLVLAGQMALCGTRASARRIHWTSPTAVLTGLVDAEIAIAADVTGNGVADPIIVTRADGTVAYAPSDGSGGFGGKVIATSSAGGPVCGLAADMDGDGDNDLVVVSTQSDELLVLNNTDGAGSFGAVPTATPTGTRPIWAIAADWDGDGDPDVAVSSQISGGTVWFANIAGGALDPSPITIDLAAVAHYMAAGSLDSDGDLDLVVALPGPRAVAWYENTNGAGAFGPQRLINASINAVTVAVADFDGDGDLDVAVGDFSGPIDVVWWANMDGAGSFGSGRVVSTLADGIQDLVAADMDGDGDFDLVAAAGNADTLAWYENTDSAGSFGPERIVVQDGVADAASGVRSADFDGDGDLDLLLISAIRSSANWFQAFPLLCPEFAPLANGTWTYTFNSATDDWDAVAECAPGFGIIGSPARVCPQGTAAWSISSPVSCLFNVSSLVLVFPPNAFPVAAGEDLVFTVEVGAGSALLGSSSQFSAVVNGSVSALPSTFDAGESVFTVTWTAPTVAATYAVVFAVDGFALNEYNGPVIPTTFAGDFANGGADTIAVRDTLTQVRVSMVDALGNLYLDPGPVEGEPVPPLLRDLQLSSLFVIDANGVQVAAPLSVGPDASVVISLVPFVVGNHSLSLLINGAPSPSSPMVVTVVCPSGQTLEPGTDNTCVLFDCNEASVRIEDVNATAGSRCVCTSGFTVTGYDSNGIAECAPCPRGGACSLGLDPPTALPGWFPDGAGGFVQCKRRVACRGGSGASVCATGYEGYMCNTCSPGYYSNDASDCKACPSAPGGLFSGVLILLVVGATSLAAVLALSLARSARDAAEGKAGTAADLRVRLVPLTPSMILVAAQVIGLLASANYAWSDSASRTLRVFNAANIDASLWSSECALDSFHTKYVMSVLIPLALLAVVMLALTVLKAVRLLGMAPVALRTALDAVLFTVAPLLYIPLSKATFVIFDCTRLPNGHWVLDTDPGVACFDGAWWSVAWLGLAALVGFVVGVPAYFLWCIVRRRHKLMDPATFVRFGPVYKAYRLPYYWGGVAELAKRLALVAIAVFVSESVLLQLGLTLVVLLASAFAVAVRAPYYTPLYNRVDVQLSLVLVVVLLLGAASYAERGSSGSSETFILVGVVLALTALGLVSACALALDIRTIIRERREPIISQAERARRLAAHIQTEIADLDPAVTDTLHQFITHVGDRMVATDAIEMTAC